MQKPKSRKMTQIGLGSGEVPRARITQAVERDTPSSEGRGVDCPSPSDAPATPERLASDVVPATRVSTKPPSRPRTSRPPLRVDEVGDAAVRLAVKAARSAAPRVLVTRAELARSPIDHREAFVVSLIDGKTDVAGLVDAAGLPRGEVMAILERLVRIGVVAL